MIHPKIKTIFSFLLFFFFLSEFNISCVPYSQHKPCTTPCQPTSEKRMVLPKQQPVKPNPLTPVLNVTPPEKKQPPRPVRDELPVERAKSTASFDYYLLALSWSPAYCKTHQQDIQQCARLPRYRFVLHGLWPNNLTGRHPFFCSNQSVDKTIIQEMLSIMPSERLVVHEWQKHGTCSGLTPKAYFDLAKKAYNNIHFPKFFYQNKPGVKSVREIKQAFVQDNPTLRYDALQVTHRRGNLIEVRICLDNALHAIRCPLVKTNQEMAHLTIIAPQPESNTKRMLG